MVAHRTGAHEPSDYPLDEPARELAYLLQKGVTPGAEPEGTVSPV